MKPTNRPLIVAVDDGFDEIKVAVYGQDGRMVKYSVPAWADSSASLVGTEPGNWIQCEGEKWLCGGSGKSFPTRFAGYHGSPMNRCLVLHALLEGARQGFLPVNFFDSPIRLCLGLPVAEYFTDGRKSDNAEAKARRFMTSPPTTVKTSTSWKIGTDVKIYSQALCAWVDYVLLDSGEVNGRRDSERVAVLDVGGNTTDVAVVSSGRIDSNYCHTRELGVFTVLERLNGILRTKFKLDRDLESSVLRSAFSTRQIKVFGVAYDISEDVSLAAQELSRAVVEFAREALRTDDGQSQMNALLLVGGGASVCDASAVRAVFSMTVVPAEPRFANARGMLRYGRYVEPVWLL